MGIDDKIKDNFEKIRKYKYEFKGKTFQLKLKIRDYICNKFCPNYDSYRNYYHEKEHGVHSLDNL